MSKYIIIFVLALVTSMELQAQEVLPSCGDNCTYSKVENGTDDAGNTTYTLKIEPIDSSKVASIQDYNRWSDGGYRTDAPWWGDSSITKVEVTNGIKSIGANAFANTSSIVEAKLPEGLETIGNVAFHRSGITSIDIPSSVKSIGSWAFVTKSLEEVTGTLENVTSIDTLAFGDTALTSFVVPPNITELAHDIFTSVNPNNNKLRNPSKNLSNIYCMATLMTQCSEAVAYRGDDIQITSYDWQGGVYIVKDENGKDIYYVSADDMQKNENICSGSLSDCQVLALQARGVCADTKSCQKLVNNPVITSSGKIYASLNDLIRGHYEKKRIYTVDEANAVSGKKNSVLIKYK